MIKKDVFIPLIKIGGTFSGGPGSFLVRPSDNSPGDYSLFFHINNQIQRFRIEKKGVRYVMGGRTFDALEAVINRYKTEQIVEGHSLGHHIRRVSSFYTSIDVNFKTLRVNEILHKFCRFTRQNVAFGRLLARSGSPLYNII